MQKHEPLGALIRARLLTLAAAVTLGLSAQAQEVVPDFYKDPGLYPNRSYVNQSYNEFIDPFSGSLQQHYVDLNLPGNGGFDLKVVRSYNSASVDSGNPAAYESAALGWSIHFGRVLRTKDTSVCLNGSVTSINDNPVLELPDGSRQIFAFTGVTSPLLLTTQRWKAECLGAGTGLTVYSPEGLQYEMTQVFNVGTAVNPVYAWYVPRSLTGTAITRRWPTTPVPPIQKLPV